MKAFLCHCSTDWKFVAQVAVHLKRNLDEVFCFEEQTRLQPSIPSAIGQALQTCDVLIVFVGAHFSEWQEREASSVLMQSGAARIPRIFIVQLHDTSGRVYTLPACLVVARGTSPIFSLDHPGASSQRPRFLRMPADYARWVSAQILNALGIPWQSVDDLPLNPHLFDYEKDIIRFYMDVARLGVEAFQEPEGSNGTEPEEPKRRSEVLQKLLDGCPIEWPQVQECETGQQLAPNPLAETEVGEWRPRDRRVVAAGLSVYHQACSPGDWEARRCMLNQNFCLCEAGPRKELCFPQGDRLKVAILVSGGIAPGINAVIDGIVQRHWKYGEGRNSNLTIYGLKNGFRAFDALHTSATKLADYEAHGRETEIVLPDKVAERANDGGCFLGTSRVDELIHGAERLDRLRTIIHQLESLGIDILYVIGGDGSMKAAHALWSVARDMRLKAKCKRELSVVAVPKTMDNDILWMWQSFGFLSAVEKARECIENLHTEVSSNPRLCVMQLFGSDSGFVVSHAVLATATGQCDAALIPEVPFSMEKLAAHLKERMLERGEPIPHGLVVMAETAIPVDAMAYIDLSEIDLSDAEKEEIKRFCAKRDEGQGVQGQTSDMLRSAGLKIVSKGLGIMLGRPLKAGDHVPPGWEHLRVVTSEPRHLLRSTRPSCSDILMGQRLGTLAVDNAMAGYTDFMISQWLTEYVLVPLKLVVLGRKRIPSSGIFWKSVLSKTRQPADMC